MIINGVKENVVIRLLRNQYKYESSMAQNARQQASDCMRAAEQHSEDAALLKASIETLGGRLEL